MVLEAGQEEEIAAINKLFPPLSMESTRLQQHVCRLYIQGRRPSTYTILVFCVLSLSFYIFYFHAACVWFVPVSCESPECEAHSTFREHAECKCGVKPATATVPCPPAERERGNIPRTHLPGPGSDLSPCLHIRIRGGTEPSRILKNLRINKVLC